MDIADSVAYIAAWLGFKILNLLGSHDRLAPVSGALLRAHVLKQLPLVDTRYFCIEYTMFMYKKCL